MAVGLAQSFRSEAGGLRARFAETLGAERARVVFPERSNAPFHMEDIDSGMAADVLLQDARDAAAEAADGYIVYRNAHLSGATMLHRALPSGTEDFLSFEVRPGRPSVDYRVTFTKVRGLRFVGNTLEMLDEAGTPRLRVAPPYLVGADSRQIEAKLEVQGCAVNSDPAAPWGQAVTAPGADGCNLHVTWSNDDLVYPALLDPKWTTTGSMSVARQNHTATVLSNGKVLVAGGTNGSTTYATAELYDPTTGTWAATGAMTGARQRHTAVLLPTSSNATTSGKVLVAGGGSSASTSLTTAQLYAPTTGTWTAAASLNAARADHTATLLANGKVLVAGGLNGTTVLNTAALYNPASGTGTWTATANMATARKFHSATLLATTNATLNNKVLVVGGTSNGSTSLTSVQLFDGTSAWSTLTALSTARQEHTATLLANGKLLIAGGRNGSSTIGTAFLFNPASGTGSWASAGSMTSPRHGQSATLLSSTVVANGQVLVVGGWNGSTTLNTAELFNGVSTWTATTTLASPVKYHTASLLPKGTVLIAGGYNGSVDIGAAQLYDPSIGVSCSTSTQCPTGFCVGGVCCNTACTDECGSCNLAGLAGTCSPKTSGTACADDGNACSTDKCNGTSLACQHAAGNAGVVCRAAGPACDVAETCSGTSTTCPADVKAPNGTPCNDGNVCTTNDVCSSGTCVPGVGVVVDDNNPCTADSCDPTLGVRHTSVSAGISCSDGNVCNGAETCNGAGTCVAGSAPPVDDGNVCTADSCDPSTGVHNTPIVGATCAPGDGCTGPSVCNSSGACAPGGSIVTCHAVDQCHLAGVCDPSTGLCSNPPNPGGPGCSGSGGAGGGGGTGGGGGGGGTGGGGTSSPPNVAVHPNPGAVTPPPPGYDPGTQGCGAGLDNGGVIFDRNTDDYYYDHFSYALNPNPTPGPNCRIAITFCDDNDHQIPAPTQDELNAAPTPGFDTCPAFGVSTGSCELDPDKTGGPCTTDADCTGGGLCGFSCTTPACTTMTRICAVPYPSCGGLPAEGACDPRPFRQCPDPRTVGTFTEDDARAELPPPQEVPKPSAEVPPAERLAVPDFYPPHKGFCETAFIPETKNTSQPSVAHQPGGNDQWGFNLDWNADYSSNVTTKQMLGDGDFDVHGELGAKVTATALGTTFTAIDANIKATAKTCEIGLTTSVKLFGGDAIALVDFQNDAVSMDATVDVPRLDYSGSLAITPPALTEACNTAMAARDFAAENLRRAVWVARDARSYFLEHGTTLDLCNRATMLNGGPIAGVPCDANVGNRFEIPNFFVQKYRDQLQSFASSVEPSFVDAQKALGGTAHIPFESIQHPFDIFGFEWNQPVGPIVITIAVDFNGEWHLNGGMDFGMVHDGQRPDVLAPPVLSGTPTVGDISVFAGPSGGAGASVSVALFAGVGLPGVSVGLEGTIVIISANAIAHAQANLNRLAQPDSRDLGGSFFAGLPFPGISNNLTHWETGYSWGAGLKLNELDGKIDLVARIRLLFFKKTFSYRLAHWKGFEQTFNLVGDSNSEPLKASADYGMTGERIAHTSLPDLTSDEPPQATDVNAFYPFYLGDNPCAIIH